MQQTERPPTDSPDGQRTTRGKIERYVETWRARGYPDDIPDEVPTALMDLLLAPSYKAICIALLQNDATLKGLGFVPRATAWYFALRQVHLPRRPRQLDLFPRPALPVATDPIEGSSSVNRKSRFSWVTGPC